MVHLSGPHIDEPIILAFHGTRHPDGEPTVRALAARVSDALGGADVRVGWVDIHPELLADQLPGVGPCTVVPCFLSAGYHVTTDVPAAAATSPHHVQVTDHLGASVLDAVIDRIAQVGGPGSTVVLAAIGSRFDAAQDEVAQAAVRLADRMGVPVRPGFIFGGAPRVAHVVADLRREGSGDITVAPYALAPGLFADRLRGLGCRLASPTGAHPAVVAAVVDRILTASLGARTPSTAKLVD